MGLKETVTAVDLKDLKIRETRPGIKGATLFDESTPTKFLFSGVFCLEPGGKLDMHYHDVEELQHVIQGYGILRDSEQNEHQLRPGTTFYCPAGPKGAHGITNASDLTFVCLYVYYSPGGKRASLTRVAD